MSGMTPIGPNRPVEPAPLTSRPTTPTPAPTPVSAPADPAPVPIDLPATAPRQGSAPAVLQFQDSPGRAPRPQSQTRQHVHDAAEAVESGTDAIKGLFERPVRWLYEHLGGDNRA